MTEVLKFAKEHPIIVGIITSVVSATAVVVALPGAVLDVAKLVEKFGGWTVGVTALIVVLIVVIIVQAVINAIVRQNTAEQALSQALSRSIRQLHRLGQEPDAIAAALSLDVDEVRHVLAASDDGA